MSEPILTRKGQVVVVNGCSGRAIWWIHRQKPNGAHDGLCIVGGNGFRADETCGWGPTQGTCTVLGKSRTKPDPVVWRAFAALRHNILLG